MITLVAGLSGCGDAPDPGEGSGEGGDVPAAGLPAAAPSDREAEIEGPDRGAPPDPPVPTLEVEPAFWWGGGTRGAEISGTFLTPEARRAVLDPRAVVGRFQGREWRLEDILVEVRFRGPRAGATWRVAGPPEVVARYLEELTDHPDRSPLESVGVLELVIVPCCGPDAGEGPDPSGLPLPPADPTDAGDPAGGAP